MSRSTTPIGVMYRLMIAALGSIALAACEEPASPTRTPDVTDPNLANLVGARVEVTPAAPKVGIGRTVQLTATVYDAHGNPLPGTYVAWHSSLWNVARVSGTGLVTGATLGTSVISATMLNGTSGSVTVTVSNDTTSDTTSTTTPPPATGGTVINPGESIQAKVDANPSGTAFLLKAGVHRMQQVQPKSGDTFTGEPGAVMSGARLLTQFTREGSYWVVGGQTQDNADRTSGSGICRASNPLCYRPEDLFINDVPLKHVGSLGEVGSGKWYFDYGADKIYFADDPTGKVIETSVSRAAFSGNVDNVTIQSLTIEKYANPLQQGAVAPGAFGQTGGQNWLVQDNTVRLNHGEGIRINVGARLLRNKVHHQGQVGIAGFGSNALVEGNEVYANNFAGVNPNWAAGGVKFNGATGYVNSDIVMRNNNVHDNDGYGLWCDFNCLRTVYEANQVTGNSSWGISQEISGSATVRNNTLAGNGGGVFISTSRDVEVSGNTISGPYAMLALDENRGTGAFGTLVLINLYVHDNTITLPSGAQNGQHIGVIQTRGTNDAFTSANNRFTSNHYTLSGVQRPFAWLNAYRTSSEWRGYGEDTNGTFTP